MLLWLIPGRLAAVPVLSDLFSEGRSGLVPDEAHRYIDNSGGHMNEGMIVAVMSVKDKIAKQTHARGCLDTGQHDMGMDGKKTHLQ